MPGALKPNVVEAHAMELIKSMLYLADTTGQFTQAAIPKEATLDVCHCDCQPCLLSAPVYQVLS